LWSSGQILPGGAFAPDENHKKREKNMTGHWRDRAATSFQCQKKPASGSRGMVVSNHPLASFSRFCV